MAWIPLELLTRAVWQCEAGSDTSVSCPLEIVVVEMLNPVLRGWGAYFRQGNSSAKFGAIDCDVHKRMARLTSRKHALSGPNWMDRFTWDWLGQLGIHRLTGTVRYPTANA